MLRTEHHAQIIVFDNNGTLASHLTRRYSGCEVLSLPSWQGFRLSLTPLTIALVLRGCTASQAFKVAREAASNSSLIPVLWISRESDRAEFAGAPEALTVLRDEAQLWQAMERVLQPARLLFLAAQLEAVNRDLRQDNRRLRRELKDMLELDRVARTITGTLFIEEILTGVLTGIREALGLERVLLGLINTEKGREEIKLAVGMDRGLLRRADWPIHDGDRVWQKIDAGKSPLLVRPSKDLPGFIQRVFPGTFLKVPMVVKDQVVGSIMADRKLGGLSRKDLRPARRFAEYAAIAIENGRLYYEMIQSEEALKKAQKQLVEAEKMAVVGSLAISVKHEVNNPLCNISLLGQTLRKEVSDPRLVAYLEEIENNVRRIQEVTERMVGLRNPSYTEYLPDQMMIDLK